MDYAFFISNYSINSINAMLRRAIICNFVFCYIRMGVSDGATVWMAAKHALFVLLYQRGTFAFFRDKRRQVTI